MNAVGSLSLVPIIPENIIPFVKMPRLLTCFILTTSLILIAFEPAESINLNYNRGRSSAFGKRIIQYMHLIFWIRKLSETFVIANCNTISVSVRVWVN